MALMHNGDCDAPREVRVSVLLPGRDADGRRRVRDDVSVVCAGTDDATGTSSGPPLTIKLSHEEALQLTAGLAVRLALRPDSTLERVTGGKDDSSNL